MLSDVGRLLNEVCIDPSEGGMIFKEPEKAIFGLGTGVDMEKKGVGYAIHSMFRFR